MDDFGSLVRHGNIIVRYMLFVVSKVDTDQFDTAVRGVKIFTSHSEFTLARILVHANSAATLYALLFLRHCFLVLIL